MTWQSHWHAVGTQSSAVASYPLTCRWHAWHAMHRTNPILSAYAIAPPRPHEQNNTLDRVPRVPAPKCPNDEATPINEQAALANLSFKACAPLAIGVT
jgi:hypothetical protein